MKKLVSLLLALAMMLTVVSALADEKEVDYVGKYTIYNGTGEKVVSLTITDNLNPDDVWDVLPDTENYKEGMDANAEALYIEYEVDEGTETSHRITLAFKTESGYEGSFDTLSIETAPITLLAAEAMTGATMITFKANQVGVYTLYNLTGEKVTEVYLTVNGEETEEEPENLVGEDGLEADASLVVTKSLAADAEGHGALTLTFKTESGYEGTFATLSIEVAPISLLSADAAAGATMISFTAPEAAE